MDTNGDWWTRGAEFVGYLGVVFGVNKWMNLGLSRRVKDIEDSRKQEPKRTVSDCKEMMTMCPTRQQVTGLTSWMERIENKLDRLIEKK